MWRFNQEFTSLNHINQLTVNTSRTVLDCFRTNTDLRLRGCNLRDTTRHRSCRKIESYLSVSTIWVMSLIRPTKRSFTPEIYYMSLFKYVTVFLERLIGLRVGFYLVFSFFVGLPPFRGILGFACWKIFKTSNTALPPPLPPIGQLETESVIEINMSHGYHLTFRKVGYVLLSGNDFTAHNFFKKPVSVQYKVISK